MPINNEFVNNLSFLLPDGEKVPKADEGVLKALNKYLTYPHPPSAPFPASGRRKK